MLKIKPLFVSILLLSLVGSAVYFALRYLGLLQPDLSNSTTPILINQEENAFIDRPVVEAVELTRELVVENVSVPWSIVWTAPNRMLFTERDGRIREVVNDQLTAKPLLTFPEVSRGGEQGLMGLAIDPNYVLNKYLYVARAVRTSTGYRVDILRLSDQTDRIMLDKVLIPNVPAGQNHAGTRLKFGPDGYLYISTGDALERTLAQDPKSLAGKILRYDVQGRIPADNPFPNSPIWSLGHRNPQGLAWTSTGALWSSEHGPSYTDGPAGGDEINLIQKGANYGWPLISHSQTQSGLISPALEFTPAVAPASLAYYDAEVIPQFRHSLFFGGLRGNGVFQVQLDIQTESKIISYQRLDLGQNLGRIRDVAQGPDGALYFSTSNQDGRGTPKPNDDKIYRITKAK
jgi:glucose/arabinose dehydrogenase